MRVADAIVDILKIDGVKFASALPGDDILSTQYSITPTFQHSNWITKTEDCFDDVQ